MAKIDQTFVAKLESNASSAAIIRTIIEYFTWLNAKLDFDRGGAVEPRLAVVAGRLAVGAMAGHPFLPANVMQSGSRRQSFNSRPAPRSHAIVIVDDHRELSLQRAQLKIDVQSDEPVWTPARQDLWRRVEQHDFEPDTPLNFTRRLARDHGWSLKDARGAVDAYRRFCFLAIVSPTPVTPSEVVDEVWHQHLIYSRDYWMIWCGERLQAPLHHDPTPGGPEAQMIHRRQYAETLALHERVFGPPSPEFWPATHLRFGHPRYHVTDRSRWLIMPKPIAWIRRLFGR